MLPQKLLGQVDQSNVLGWHSLSASWDKVGWPRRPKWSDEFAHATPILSTLKGQDVLVLGSTPEFRVWLRKFGARVSVCEISAASYSSMTEYLARRGGLPKNESLIRRSWLDPELECSRYKAVLGDLVSGYLPTQEQFRDFIANIHRIMADGGVFLLKEFVLLPCDYPLDRIANPHQRRWSAALTPGIAIDGDNYHEEGLVQFLGRHGGDPLLLATCARPHRVRLMLTFDEFTAAFERVGLTPQLLVPPEASPSKPALWALWK